MADRIRILGQVFDLPAGKREWKFTPRPGGWHLAEAPDGSRLRLAATRGNGKLSVSFIRSQGGVAWQCELLAKPSRDGGVTAGVEADLLSQFPGKVGKLLVVEGQRVAAGEPLLMVEAMKMEFAIKAPYPGTVRKILVTVGQQLSPGDRFLDLEALVKEGTPS